MELGLQTPDGETTAVEFGADAHVGDVVAAFEADAVGDGCGDD